MSIDLQTKCKEYTEWTFDYFLAKRFTKSELEEAYRVYIGPTHVREFRGPARSVSTQALKQIGTARRKDMLVYLDKALKIYDDVPRNGDQYFGPSAYNPYVEVLRDMLKNLSK